MLKPLVPKFRSDLSVRLNRAALGSPAERAALGGGG